MIDIITDIKKHSPDYFTTIHGYHILQQLAFEEELNSLLYLILKDRDIPIKLPNQLLPLNWEHFQFPDIDIDELRKPAPPIAITLSDEYPPPPDIPFFQILSDEKLRPSYSSKTFQRAILLNLVLKNNLDLYNLLLNRVIMSYDEGSFTCITNIMIYLQDNNQRGKSIYHTDKYLKKN